MERTGYKRHLEESDDRGDERLENIQEFQASAREYTHLGIGRSPDRVPGEREPGQRRGQLRREARRDDANHAAPEQGPGVPGGVHSGYGRGFAAPFPLDGNRRRNRRRASLVLRGRNPRAAAVVSVASVPARLLGRFRPKRSIALPRRRTAQAHRRRGAAPRAAATCRAHHRAPPDADRSHNAAPLPSTGAARQRATPARAVRRARPAAPAPRPRRPPTPPATRYAIPHSAKAS